MKLGFIIGTTLVASMSASVEAGVLGYAAFARTASNGNVVIDVFTVVSNASDRLLNVYNVNLTTTQGGSTLATFVQQALQSGLRRLIIKRFQFKLTLLHAGKQLRRLF